MSYVSQAKGWALAPYRVLDLSGEEGLLCGKILADLGADVIKVEKPGGDQARSIGPFWQDIAHPEKSLYWSACNTGKRSVTLDIDTHDGRDIFKRLATTADVVIETFPPGHMATLGLGYSDLSRINPRIVLTSITAFGQTGPYAQHRLSDIVAMGGQMFITGDPDRPPVRVSVPQAYLHAGAEAAVGTMVAMHVQQSAGQGQHVDVSIAESTIPAASVHIPNWEMLGVIVPRAGAFRGGLVSGVVQRQVWRCKDGYVTFALLGGGAGSKTARRLTEWMDEEGMAAEILKQMDWDAFDRAKGSQKIQDEMEAPIAKFFMKYTKEELREEAFKRRIMLLPVSSIGDLLRDTQLGARGFWMEMEHSQLDAAITYPGGFVRSSEMNCGPRKLAPLIGEHNLEVYQELGLGLPELIELRQAGVI